MKHFRLILLVLLLSNILLADAFLWRHLFASSKGHKNSTEPSVVSKESISTTETNEKSTADARAGAQKPEPKIAGAANGKDLN